MHALVTGGGGYIGSHIALYFFEKGWDVTIYDNFSRSKFSVGKRLEKVSSGGIRVVVGDICDFESILAALLDKPVDVVVHCAGLKSVSESIKFPDLYNYQNVTGTENVIKAMASSGTRCLVFSGSATIYGHPLYTPIDEHHPVKPLNPYGETKWLIERRLSQEVGLVLRSVSLRYFNPLGNHSSNLVGDDPLLAAENIGPNIVRVLRGEQSVFTIFGADYPTADGTAIRDYIHVMDLACAHLLAAEFILNEQRSHAFNLGSEKPCSVLELVEMFENISGLEVPREYGSRRPGDAPVSISDSTAAARELGWRATKNLEEMCRSSWAYNLIGHNDGSSDDLA